MFFYAKVTPCGWRALVTPRLSRIARRRSRRSGIARAGIHMHRRVPAHLRVTRYVDTRSHVPFPTPLHRRRALLDSELRSQIKQNGPNLGGGTRTCTVTRSPLSIYSGASPLVCKSLACCSSMLRAALRCSCSCSYATRECACVRAEARGWGCAWRSVACVPPAAAEAAAAAVLVASGMGTSTSEAAAAAAPSPSGFQRRLAAACFLGFFFLTKSGIEKNTFAEQVQEVITGVVRACANALRYLVHSIWRSLQALRGRDDGGKAMG